jgi:FAD/FMN-containing dehydrogenase
VKQNVAPEIAESLFQPFATHGKEHGSGLDVMRRIKAALDAENILNPGKLGL